MKKITLILIAILSLSEVKAQSSIYPSAGYIILDETGKVINGHDTIFTNHLPIQVRLVDTSSGDIGLWHWAFTGCDVDSIVYTNRRDTVYTTWSSARWCFVDEITYNMNTLISDSSSHPLDDLRIRFNIQYRGDEATGIRKVKREEIIKIYPNPVHNYLTIKTVFGNKPIYEITIFGTNAGNVVDDFSGKTTFDVHNLTPGLWTCIVVFKDGTWTSKNFIKQ